MKKTLSVLISALLAFAGLSVVTAPAHAAEHTVIMHYHRFDASYEDWNLWFWGTSSVDETNDQYFEVDENASTYAATFEFTVDTAETSGFGFVLRSISDWSEYYDGCKDGGDHFVSLNLDSDTTEVWVVEGSDEVFYEEVLFPQSAKEVKPSVKVGKVTALPKNTEQGSPITWTSKTKATCKVVKVKGSPKVQGVKAGLCRVKGVAVGFESYSRYNNTIALFVK